MKEEYYMPIYIKAILAFLLIMVGIFFTFIAFRFFPMPKEAGYDAFGALMLILTGLGGTFILFILGLILDRKHPYSLFTICIAFFLGILILIRWLAVQ